MTKDVLVSIKGLQYMESESNDNQRIETLTRGTFYNRNNKNFVNYEESPDGAETVKSLIKFDKNFLELTKKGKYSVHMVFEEGKKNYTNYQTPYGNFILGIDTNSISYSEKEQEINMSVVYDMEMNYEHLAHCEIDMKVTSV